MNDEREQYTHTSLQGTGGFILYSIITLCTARRVSLTLRRSICLSSVSIPLSLLPPLHHHMHLFYLSLSVPVRLNPSLLTVLSTILSASIAVSFFAVNNRIQTHKYTHFQWVFTILECDIELCQILYPKRSCESFKTMRLHLLIFNQYRFTIKREINKG